MVDRLLERHGADVREVVHTARPLAVVEQCLDCVGLGAPAPDGSSSTDGPLAA
jgi:hypothetical protein